MAGGVGVGAAEEAGPRRAGAARGQHDQAEAVGVDLQQREGCGRLPARAVQPDDEAGHRSRRNVQQRSAPVAERHRRGAEGQRGVHLGPHPGVKFHGSHLREERSGESRGLHAVLSHRRSPRRATQLPRPQLDHRQVLLPRLAVASAAAPSRAGSYADGVELEFRAEVWFWRGPSPFHFVTVPEGPSGELQATSALVTYGWGMIPVEVQIGSTRWRTSLFPKNGGYLVPVKALVRRSEGIDVGDTVTVRLVVEV